MSSPSSELRHVVVRAGAGAGKTRGLVDKVVEVYRGFLRKGSASPRIVLTTFTRKATQELKERLILRACHERDAGLLQFVSDPSRLQIVTIHGLLNIFLKQVGHLAGLDSGFQIISEGQGEHLARLALREVLVSDGGDGLRWLEVYGFERILEMCRRYQTFLKEQVELRPPQAEHLESITSRFVSDWRIRLNDLHGKISKQTDDGSWQKYASALKSFTECWTGDSAQLADLPSKPRRSKKQIELECLHLEIETVIDEFKKQMGKSCWNRGLWTLMLGEWRAFGSFAESFCNALQRIKNAQARFELADLELKSLEILREKPFLGQVFAEGWDFWMIDEYQDTSPLQVEILNRLIDTRPKYVVGDPQQSIYFFRGAEVGVFKLAEDEVAKLGGESIELRKNFRSDPSLLLWVNDFMSSYGPSFRAMEPREVVTFPNESVPITLWRAADDQEELQGLAARVGELLADGARLEDICVLGRTHRNLMDVSRVLKAHGFPTHVHSARGFTSRREVIDAQALWKFLVNPHDNVNLMILFRSPWFFVTDAQLTDWMKERPVSLWRRLAAEALSGAPEALGRLHGAVAMVANLGLVRAFERTIISSGMLDLSLVNDPAGRKESNIWKLIHKASTLEKAGTDSILQLMEAEPGNPLDASEGDAASAQEPNSINLMTIHGSKGLEFEHVLIPRMGESPRASSTPPLHALDGLFHFPVWSEADLEFVASPLDFEAQRKRRQKEFEEFDRWLYVAVTRAKKTLTLSWSKVMRDSWAERSSWFQKSPGTHATPNYNFRVVEKMAEPSVYRAGGERDGPVRPLWASPPTHHGKEHRSVSDLIATNVEGANHRPDVLTRWQAQTVGTRIHRALQALKYRRTEDLDPGDEASGPEAEAVRFVLNLADPPLRQWIAEGHPEWGFQVKTPFGVVEGQIDLWAKQGGKLFVVDYKSGSAKPEQRETAFRQLGLYAWALRKFGHVEPAELIVIYPMQKKVARRSFTDEQFNEWESNFAKVSVLKTVVK